jgi:hypothetical protein
LHRGIIGQLTADLFGEVANCLIEYVADTFEEEERGHVATKFGVINIAPQDVRGFFQKCIQFRLSHAAAGNGEGGCFVGHTF